MHTTSAASRSTAQRRGAPPDRHVFPGLVLSSGGSFTACNKIRTSHRFAGERRQSLIMTLCLSLPGIWTSPKRWRRWPPSDGRSARPPHLWFSRAGAHLSRSGNGKEYSFWGESNTLHPRLRCRDMLHSALIGALVLGLVACYEDDRGRGLCWSRSHVCEDLLPGATSEQGELQAEDDWQPAETRVEKGASIGSNATILGGVVLGRHSMVGAERLIGSDVGA